MKNTIKIATAVLISGAFLSTCIAAPNQQNQVMASHLGAQSTGNSNITQPRYAPQSRFKKQRINRRHRKACYRRSQPTWDLGIRRGLKLTRPQATTITRAALIMQGFKRLHVGKVTPIAGKKRNRAYLVEIKNRKNATIRRVMVNAKNGRIRPLQKKTL